VIRILGGGPAGSTAALAALREGSAVEIVERSKFPRHKVCGEFVSPEIAPVFERLGVLEAFECARPYRVRRMELHFGSTVKRAVLPEPAFGLSRYAFDDLLHSAAVRSGAEPAQGGEAAVIACGRHLPGHKHTGDLFGFKAHFEGPADDAVELFFFPFSYVGINCIEGGLTNVCGLTNQRVLRDHDFDPDRLMDRCPALRERLRPMRRSMKWMFTGPLEFAQRWERRDAFYCGDALSFVDPFTGSGMLCAAVTGSLAGQHAARRSTVEAYLDACRREIARPFRYASALRMLAGTAVAEALLPLVPARVLFRLTRPR
jgi:2-polyprenyl-6-methoxyphenol hydroxylase-like FAD-dependent oxidoreductase